MVKAKRVTGSREAPNLPTLKKSDIKMFMWKGITKPVWTLKEAAYYVNEEDPDYSEKKISPKESNEVSKTYMWLLQEVSQNRLHPIPYGDESEEHIFSPGAIMRHIWEGEKYVSLTIWSMYDHYSQGSFSPGILREISIPFYQQAADILWEEYPTLSKKRMAEIISPLPEYFRDDPEFNYVPKMDAFTLEERFKGNAKRKKGRPSKTEVQREPDLDEVIDFIKEKMGAKTGRL